MQRYNQALSMYEKMKSNPENFCSMHVLLLGNGNEKVRLTVMTFLATQIFKTDEIYKKLTPQYRKQFNTSALQRMKLETDTSVLNQYVNLFEMVYSFIVTSGELFPEFLPAIFEMIHTGDRPHKHYAQALLTKIIVSFPENDMRNKLQTIIILIKEGLQDQDGDVITESMSLIKELIQYAMNVPELFGVVIPLYPILHDVTIRMVNNKEYDAYYVYVFEIEQQIFQVYIEQLVNYIPTTVLFALNVCNAPTDDYYDDQLHTIAMELIVTIFEIYPKEIKKLQELQTNLYVTLINWLGDVDDLKEWYDYQEDEEDTPLFYQAQEAIERITTMIGATQFVNFLIQHIELLTSTKWEMRLAFITAMNSVLSSKKKSVGKVVVQIFDAITPLYKDPHPRVRHAAIVFALKVFKLYPKTQTILSGKIMQIIGLGLEDKCSRNVSKTCELSSCFIPTLTLEELEPYISIFFRVFTPLITTTDSSLSAEALCSLSNVISKLKKGSNTYFVEILPMLEKVINELSDDEDLYDVKGRTIEMVSFIVTKTQGDLLKKAFEITMKGINSVLAMKDLEPDNLLYGYVESVFSRLAEVTKENILPYVPMVLPKILERVNMNIVSNYQYFETTTVQFGDEIMNVYIEAAEEKVNAMKALADIAVDLKGFFVPYVPKCFQIVIPLIGYKASFKVRNMAVRCSVNLLISYINGKEKEFGNTQNAMVAATVYSSQVIEAIVNNLKFEPEIGVVTEQLNGLQRVIELNMTPIGINQAVIILGLLKELFVKYIQRSELIENQDEDVENEEQFDPDNNFNYSYRSLLKCLSYSMGEAFIPSFEGILLPMLQAVLTTNGVSTRIIGTVALVLSTVAMISERVQYVNVSVPIVVQLANSKNQDNLFQAIECIQLLSQIQIIQPFLPQMIEIINYCMSLKATNENLYEAGVMVLGKCISFNPQYFKPETALLWFSLLPIPTYPDDILQSLFTLFALNKFPITHEILEKALIVLLNCLGSKDSYMITSQTKDMVTERLKQWYETNDNIIGPILDSASPTQKELLKELL
ncbi:importin beta-3 subunit, putative [Entamoeba invadens IP1]|uniref:Importin beta-3 subunit, putative n=1 Tax=Entamoeba invadens IP1 TaxID=370355 RepID=A0A0A1TWH6_ENTIV|nr:importin beta-3 subunit, putative [Entamoeba invadens IP1]ELP85549.1 importin beta-3 subunit, putative [Entamoeba invadens IP1]|eukprot:XP_004184895.1 importin beta-3 subunit, putative [Entamoeba invadens IP1]